MSLLNQDTEEVDDAARGEEFTKGSSHVIWAAVIATIVVSAAASRRGGRVGPSATHGDFRL